MSNSRGITTFILTLGLTVLIFTACETQPERERVGVATPSPTVGITPSKTERQAEARSQRSHTSEREFVINAARGRHGGSSARQPGSAEGVEQ